MTQTRTPWRWLLLIVALSIVTQGYAVGLINHGLQIPLVRHFAGDDAFAHDPFIQDLAHSYTTIFYPLVGLLARVVPLPALLFALFLGFRILNTFLAWRLGKALFDDEKAALANAAACSVQTLTFAEDIVSDIYLTHGAAAQAFTLGTLVLLANGRVLPAVALVGLQFNVHGMHAAHLALVLGVACLPMLRDRFTARPLIIGGALCALFTVPTLVWMKVSGAMGQPIPEGYADAIKDWFPTHFWPSTWGVLDACMLLLPVVAGPALVKLAGPTRDGGITARVALTALVLGALGGLAVELWPHPTLIRFHPMRLSWIMVLAGMPFLARVAVDGVRHLDLPSVPDARIRSAVGVSLFIGLSVATLYRSSYWLGMAPALWLVLQWDRGPARRFFWLGALTFTSLLVPWLHVSAGGAALPAADATAEDAAAYYAVEGAVGLYPLISVWWAFLQVRQGPHKGFLRGLLLWSAAALAVVHLGVRGVVVASAQRRGTLGQWHAVQDWSAANLPRGATVMVPLTQMGFRVWSNQIPAVDFQEGDVLFHNPGYAERFLDKLRLYGWKRGTITGFAHYQRLDPLDAALTADDARRVGAALGATVAVRRATHPAWDLLELFRNRKFVVYRLDAPPAAQ